MTYEEMEPALHAALAALVAAWEMYIESVVLEFLDRMVDPSSTSFSALLTVLRSEAQRATDAFNTPNFENSRNLILRFTGFDPYSSMLSPRLGFSVQQSQTRLNEILKVRHSFAHSFPMPSLAWLRRYGVSLRLTRGAVKDTEKILRDLVDGIDMGLNAHGSGAFGKPLF